MIRLLIFLLILPILSPAKECIFTPAFEAKKIAVTQIVEHLSLNKVREETLAVLKSNCLIRDEAQITFFSAQGNIATAVQIAKKLASDKPDVILAISTQSAQTIIKYVNNKIPVVFAAVTDARDAKLVSNGANVTGVLDAQPIERQLELIKELMPEAKRLGIIYNNAEISSVKQVKTIESMSNLKIIKSVATSTQNVAVAMKKLIGKVDAIYLPLDNTVVSTIELIINIAKKNKVPLFSADPDLVSRGVFASVGFTYSDVGRLAGQKMAAILKGSSASTLPIQSPGDIRTFINK